MAKKPALSHIGNGVFQDAEAIKAEAERTVEGWFVVAKTYDRSVGINLWYPPNNEAWRKLTRPLLVGGVDTGLTVFGRDVYRRTCGPSDCEENLWWVGKLKGLKVELRKRV